MALVIPQDHYQALVPIQHARLSRSAAITFGIRVEPGIEDPAAVADEIMVVIGGSLVQAFDSETLLGPVVLTFDQGAEGRGSISGALQSAGTRTAGDSAPPNVAVLVKKITSRVGRPGRGRFFLPWCLGNETVNDVGQMDTSVNNALQDIVDEFLSDLQTDTNPKEMVILHDENVPGTTTPSLVTALLVDTTVATQRRRLRS